jgi:hypothetical protein
VKADTPFSEMEIDPVAIDPGAGPFVAARVGARAPT